MRRQVGAFIKVIGYIAIGAVVLSVLWLLFWFRFLLWLGPREIPRDRGEVSSVIEVKLPASVHILELEQPATAPGGMTLYVKGTVAADDLDKVLSQFDRVRRDRPEYYPAGGRPTAWWPARTAEIVVSAAKDSEDRYATTLLLVCKGTDEHVELYFVYIDY